MRKFSGWSCQGRAVCGCGVVIRRGSGCTKAQEQPFASKDKSPSTAKLRCGADKTTGPSRLWGQQLRHASSLPNAPDFF